MAIFLISACVSTLIFLWIIFVVTFVMRGRGSDGISYDLQGIAEFWFRPLWFAIFVSMALILIGMVLVGTVLVLITPWTNPLHQAADWLTSPEIGKVLLGFIFGLIFSTWLTRLYVTHPEFLSLQQKAEAIMLIIIFVVGTTPSALFDLLRGASVDTGVVKLQLANIDGRDVSDDEKGDKQRLLNPPPSNRQINEESASSGLFLLKAIPGFINLDNQYIRAYDADKGKRWDSHKVGTNHFVEEEGGETTGLLAIFRCMNDLEQDSDHNHKVEQFAAEIATPLHGALRQSQFNIKKNRSKDGPSENLTDTGDENTWNVSPEIEAELLSAFVNVARHASRYAETLDPNPMESAVLCVELRKMLNKIKPAGRDVNGLPVIYDWSTLEEFKNALSINGLDGSFGARPYYPIALAALLAMNRQELAAISFLDRWIDGVLEIRISNRSGRIPSGNIPQSHEISFWHLLRIAGVKAVIFDAYVNRQSHQVPTIVLDHTLGNLESYIDLLESIPDVQTNKKNKKFFPIFRFPGTGLTLMKSEFLVDLWPFPQRTCPVDEEDEKGIMRDILKLRFLAARISMKSSYVDHAVKHNNYKQSHYMHVRSHISELVNLDYSCFIMLFDKLGHSDPKSFTKTYMAKVLYLFAQVQIVNIRKRPDIGESYKGWAKNQATLARNALKYALVLTEQTEDSLPKVDSGVLTFKERSKAQNDQQFRKNVLSLANELDGWLKTLD
ncbi:hypothetical protein [Hoeflea poritis]|uniref:Uncharacterized protein n=1 Tax=Hoeflea poritis TaxID=2993659 RepID=A0ABT4VKP6_9HYPH|nr:hypothetical protein [Hoeflea poritis]MDA4845264.1 hypothetical protein [Hoeflea poritis]